MTRARLDQHFLADDAIASRIVAAADLRPGEDVVEIGPGRGILTEKLLDTGARVTAVELDDRLHAALAAKWKDRPDFRPVHADFLKLDLGTLPSPAKFVANLPYSVATPILQLILPWPGWTTAVLMFQKEVAERIGAGAGSRKYGILSLSVAVHSDAYTLLDVPKRCFRPQPQVDSAVVRFTRLERPRLPEGLAEKGFFKVVRAAFSQRRKMAANPLAGMLGLDRAAVVAAMGRSGIDASARAEDISLERFILLARELI